MKIEVWSDFVCPFCYIGKRELEKALQTAGYGDQVKVEFKSYLLDPTTPVNTQQTVYEALSEKYNMPESEIIKMTANVAARAKEVGLDYNFAEMKNANTVAAHRLAKWAATFNKEEALNEALLEAYFINGKAIGNHEELIALATQVGLDGELAKQVLVSEDFKADVDQDIYEAQQLGVRGVPFFVLDNRYGISGAQPQQVFIDTIHKAAGEAGLKPKLQIIGDGTNECTDGSCEI